MVIFAPVIAGLLMYAAFAPVALWWCGPIAMAILVYLLHAPHFSRRLISVAIFATAFFAPLLSWSNVYVGNIPWIILTVLQILFLLPIAFLHLSKDKPFTLLLFPSAWILTELVRTRFPFGGFGWGRAAYSQADAPYSSLARLGGVPLLSFTVATLGVSLYLLLSGLKGAALIILVVITVPTFFISSALVAEKKSTIRDFSIVAVQGGVPQLGLAFNSRATAVFENHLKLTQKYLSHRKSMPDLILWPENSVDVDPSRFRLVGKEIQGLVDTYSTPIVLGAVLEKGNNFQNASILWMPKTGQKSTYIKKHLTPFGEYIPLRPIAELVSPYAKNVTDFLPGHELVVHHLGRGILAPIICFELLDDQIGRGMAQQSNAFLIQTNSATFGTSYESAQQLGIARIRSIEHDRFSVSISTSGLSALIDPSGQVSHQTKLNQSAVIDGSIGLVNSLTVSDKYGQQIELALIWLPIALFISIFFYRRGRRMSRK